MNSVRGGERGVEGVRHGERRGGREARPPNAWQPSRAHAAYFTILPSHGDQSGPLLDLPAARGWVRSTRPTLRLMLPRHGHTRQGGPGITPGGLGLAAMQQPAGAGGRHDSPWLPFRHEASSGAVVVRLGTRW